MGVTVSESHVVYVRGVPRSAHASRLEALLWIKDDRGRTRRSLHDYRINNRSWRDMVSDRLRRD